MVVVGSRGCSAVGRVLLGSVSQLVLQHSPCSVRVARCAREAVRVARPIRVLLGVDVSPDSAMAVAAVGARSWPAGAEIHVVSVLDSRLIISGFDFGPPADLGTDEAFGSLESRMKGVAAELGRSGLATSSALLVGDPKRALVSEAQRVGADCILLGAKGHGRIERLLLGSVSTAVAARARTVQ